MIPLIIFDIKYSHFITEFLQQVKVTYETSHPYKEHCHYKNFTSRKVKAKLSHCKPGQVLGVPVGSGSQISRKSAYEGGKVVSPTHLPPYPQKTLLILFSVRG
jgi:hypothetical protein